MTQAWHDWLVTPTCIIAWFTANISVVLLNKLLLANFGFRYPIFLTCCHMVACSLLAQAAGRLGLFTLAKLQSRLQLAKITGLAAIFCTSLACGNAALKFIPVSFVQMIGATTPMFTAVLSLVITRSREGVLVYLTLIPIVVGMAVAAGGEPSFHLLGFCLEVAATCSRALKSVVQGLLLHDSEKLDSLSLLSYMSVLSVAMLLPAAAIWEHNAFSAVPKLAKSSQWFIPLLVLNSLLAFGVNWTNFLVTKQTSALTLQVLGNVKGVLGAAISIALFRNPITAIGCVGYTMTVGGVFGYSQAKRHVSQRQQHQDSEKKLLVPLVQPPLQQRRSHTDLSLQAKPHQQSRGNMTP